MAKEEKEENPVSLFYLWHVIGSLQNRRYWVVRRNRKKNRNGKGGILDVERRKKTGGCHMVLVS